MLRRSLILLAVVLLLELPPLRADEPTRSIEPAKPLEALWRFDTHG